MIFTVTYWTGSKETVAANSLQEAYTRVGYDDEKHGSHLWDNEDGTGTVTNCFGDYCATITPEG